MRRKRIAIWAAIALCAPAIALAGGKGKPARKAASTDAQIGRVMRAHAPQIQQCYEQQLSQNPKLAGRVQLTFVAEPDGSVTGAKVEDAETTLKSSELHRCLLAEVARWRLPRHSGEGVVVSLPVVFTQAD